MSRIVLLRFFQIGVLWLPLAFWSQPGTSWAWTPRGILLYGIGTRPFPAVMAVDYPLARARAWLEAIGRAEAMLPKDINTRIHQLGLPLVPTLGAVAALLYPLDVVTPEHAAGREIRVFLSTKATASLEIVLADPWRLLLEMAILWETRQTLLAMQREWPRDTTQAGNMLTTLEEQAALLRELWAAALQNALKNTPTRPEAMGKNSRVASVPMLLMQAMQWPDAPESVAQAERAIELCLQREVNDSYPDIWSLLVACGNYVRARGHERRGQPALAETDFDTALARMRRIGVLPGLEAQTTIARGELRRKRGNVAGMCEDYHAACSLGQCQRLAQARREGLCIQ